MTLDLAIRQAMVNCLNAGGAAMEITYKLGDIPWKITLEIDAEALPESTEGKSDDK